MPERLVTLRRYTSVNLAEDDCRILIDQGIDAYIGSTGRRGLGEVRVPQSQIEKALALLPPPAPDLLAPPEALKQCPWCGSERSRYEMAQARYLVLAGIPLVVWLVSARQFEVATLGAVVVLFLMFGTKVINGQLVCANCGMEWRARDRAPEPERESERELEREPEHEPRRENPEA